MQDEKAQFEETDGALGVPVQTSYDLAQAPEALTALAGTHAHPRQARHPHRLNARP
jgi:hypothetical protein